METEGLIKSGERLDDLQCSTLKIIQDKRGYTFTMDAVLLANMVRATKNSTVVDLGTGTGVIPLLVAGKTNAKRIVGIEVQKRLFEMASRSVLLNGLEKRITLYHADIEDAFSFLPKGSVDVVVTNPPYYLPTFAHVQTDEKTIAREEVLTTHKTWLQTASDLLKFGGLFFMVMKAERLADSFYHMRRVQLEPKRLIPIQPTPAKNVDTFLVEARKNGGMGMVFEKPLVVFDEHGNYNEEIVRIYKQ